MRIILCFLIIGTGVIVGKKLSERYKRKERFYFDMVTFCNSYKVNLEYHRKRLADLFDENIYGQDFNKYVECFNSFEGHRQSGEKILTYLGFDERERRYVSNFFDSLGKNDADSQAKEIEFYYKYFENALKSAQELATQRSSMVMKLSVLCAFLLCIMII
jgi:stage III sporulation protein AB